MFYGALRGHHHHHRRLFIIQVPVQHQHESRYIMDEQAMRSLARSWRVDAPQPALLDSSAIAAIPIPASSFIHPQSPSASASAFVTPHVSISTSPPRENSRIYNGDSSSRRLRAPSTAKPPQSYPSSSKVRVEDLASLPPSRVIKLREVDRLQAHRSRYHPHHRCPHRPALPHAVRPHVPDSHLGGLGP